MSTSSILSPSPARRSIAQPRTWTESYGVARHPVWLFGAGHVGRALVLALAPLPFALTWCDSREGAFPAHIPANVTPLRHDAPDVLVGQIPAGALVLVMSHSHPIDLAVTAAALARDDLPFVGLIGSKTKRARFEKRYRELGITDERIAQLSCPIGIAGIADKDPAIIAAATAAQLLALRETLPHQEITDHA
ncbi:xanthine dehydrogenase accessory protein XdhC [Saliniramus sp.]|uniref:xanthine dehydrogenase accessory protein XdhC n=1 Tax=Saliniramus sp. TaxID=2986772 RepID=UPI002C1D937D|nr:xanthine dehydrogenase accessory protein XdhC [Saliniramus sp.]HMB11476.1 xanthine dehydrogenase accessory protein XdhC [Saliniramus sp.]